MKKLLIPLVCLFLLSGCVSDQITPNTPEDDKDKQEEPTDEKENPGESGEDENPEEGDGDTYERTITATFCQGTFAGQLEQPATKERFINYVNGDTGLISSIDFEGKSTAGNLEFGEIEDGVVKKVQHNFWWLGAQSNTGTLTMNFAFEVTSIKLEIQAYYKQYVNTWEYSTPTIIPNCDTNSKLYIDSEEHLFDLSIEDDTTIPEKVNAEVNYSTPTKTITIGNMEENQRVFIHKMEISYIQSI